MTTDSIQSSMLWFHHTGDLIPVWDMSDDELADAVTYCEAAHEMWSGIARDLIASPTVDPDSRYVIREILDAFDNFGPASTAQAHNDTGRAGYETLIAEQRRRARRAAEREYQRRVREGQTQDV